MHLQPPLRFANTPPTDGASPSGKASVFGTDIRRFDPSRPSQFLDSQDLFAAYAVNAVGSAALAVNDTAPAPALEITTSRLFEGWLAAEDRCHLNGLAVEHGAPA